MKYLKTGLLISTFFILLSMIFLQYDVSEVNTIIGVFIIPSFIINVALILKIFQPKKNNAVGRSLK